MIIRKQKSKELSQQTNQIRKRLYEEKKLKEDLEEKRRIEILKSRVLKHRIATEKYQRGTEHYKESNKSKQIRKLKDGKYDILGHVIEIKNGIRVNSTLQSSSLISNHDNKVSPNTNTKHQINIYTPEYILKDHLNVLLNQNIGNKNVNTNFLDKKQLLSNKDGQFTNRIQTNHYSEKNDTEYLLEHELPDTYSISGEGEFVNEIDIIEECIQSGSISLEDSLDEIATEFNNQKVLKSSLKDTSISNESFTNRKVSFSNSIEFNDGKCQLLITKPVSKLSLIKKMHLSYKKEESSQEVLVYPNKPTLTTEQLLDKMRRDVLLLKYPENNDCTNPESIVTTDANNVAVVSTTVSHCPVNESRQSSMATNFNESNIENRMLNVNIKDNLHCNGTMANLNLDQLKHISSNKASIPNRTIRSSTATTFHKNVETIVHQLNGSTSSFNNDDSHILNCTVEHPYIQNNTIANSRYDRKSEEIVQTTGINEVTVIETIPNDDIFHEIEASLAGLKFENTRKSFLASHQNKSQKQSVNSKNNKADIAVRQGISVPLRRGRIIVSADCKKRQQPSSKFYPQPPKEKKPSSDRKMPITIAKNVSIKMNNPADMEVNKSSLVSSNRSLSVNSDLLNQPREHVNHTNHRPVDFDYNCYNMFNKNNAPFTQSQKCIKGSNTIKNNKHNSSKPPIDCRTNIKLNKTPTDDEINKLWQNVRNCLDSDTSSEHTNSDSYCLQDGNPRIYHRRLSGSNFTRSNYYNQPNYHTKNTIDLYGLTNKHGRNQEITRKQDFNDKITVDNGYLEKSTLLSSRASKVVRNSSNNRRFIHNRSKTSNSNKYNEVSESLVSFLTLEELCARKSLTPKQSENIFQASKFMQQKNQNDNQHQYYGMSALSIEEKCVMESLERIDKKLQGREV